MNRASMRPELVIVNDEAVGVRLAGQEFPCCRYKKQSTELRALFPLLKTSRPTGNGLS